MKAIFSSWKTTSAAVILLALVAAFLMGRIDVNEFMAAAGTAAAGGLLLAGDAAKSKPE